MILFYIHTNVNRLKCMNYPKIVGIKIAKVINKYSKIRKLFSRGFFL